MRDTDGFIWLYTNNGVSRFNGFEFNNYNLSNGFPSHGAYTGAVDHKGRIWFVTFNDSTCYYENNEFHRFNTPYTISWVIFTDIDMYLLTTNGHVLWYKNDHLFKDIAVCYSKLQGGCWISGNKIAVHSAVDGAYIVDNDVVKKIKQRRYDYTFLRFYKLKNGDILASDPDAIYELKGDKLEVIYNLLVKNRHNYECFDIADDGNGFFICQSGGVFVCKNKYDIKNAKPLYKKGVATSLVYDINDNYWFATRSDGMYTFKPNKILNRVFYHNNGNIVKSISGHNKEDVYFFYENGQIDQLVCKNLCVLKPVTHLNNIIRAVTTTNNSFVIASNDVGYKLQNGKVKRIKHSFMYAYDFDSTLYEIGPDYVLTNNKTRQRILLLSNDEKRLYTQQLGNLNIRTATVHKDTLWIGNEAGIFKITHGLAVKPFSNEIARTYVADIKTSRKGEIWVATKGRGIYCIINNRLIMPKSKTLQHLTCNSLFVDSDDNVWVASQEGLYKIMRHNDTFSLYSFNYRTLLPGAEVENVFKRGDEVFVCSNTGVNIFNEQAATYEQKAPKIFIKGIYINNKAIVADTLLMLKYYENNLRFEFTALDFSYIKKPAYYYCLKNRDSTWVHTDQSSIDFSYLPPGAYSFYVVAENMDGIKSTSPAHIFLIITPPFWQTWWFYILCIFSLTIVIIMLLHYNKKANYKKRQYIEAELKALRAQMNPHFIFNSLNAMQDFILQNDTAKANEYLVKFATLMRGMLENSKRDYISLASELRFLTLYLEIETLRFENKFQYAIHIDPGIDLTQTFIPSMILQPFIENAINHGLVPKKSIGIVNINIEKYATGRIICVIEDNGVGRQFQQTHTHEPTGILNTESRLQLLNAAKASSISIHDLKDDMGYAKGTRVEILIDTRHYKN